MLVYKFYTYRPFSVLDTEIQKNQIKQIIYGKSFEFHSVGSETAFWNVQYNSEQFSISQFRVLRHFTNNGKKERELLIVTPNSKLFPPITFKRFSKVHIVGMFFLSVLPVVVVPWARFSIDKKLIKIGPYSFNGLSLDESTSMISVELILKKNALLHFKLVNLEIDSIIQIFFRVIEYCQDCHH